MTVLMLNRLSPLLCVDRYSYSGLSDSDDDVTSQACQSECVFFTDIGVDCCVAVAFVDKWHPDIVVKVLYAQRALVNVMHPVQDIHSWKDHWCQTFGDSGNVFMSNVTSYFRADFD